MKSKILRILEASMLAVGICTLTSCFYGGGGGGWSPGYSYAPEYVAPYRSGPVVYAHPAPVYQAPAYHAWEHGHSWHHDRDWDRHDDHHG